jgi:hypothetical protein
METATMTRPTDGIYGDSIFTVPESKYALVRPNGELGFCEVKRGRKGTKWESFVFVDILIGAPGDWRRIPAKGEQRKQILALLAKDGYQNAAVRYSREYTVCACCGSPLSDPESLALGLGPICARRF